LANHKSALKRNRQSIKRNALNNINKTKANNAVKKVRLAIAEAPEKAEVGLKNAMSILHKGVSKGTFHKKTAARRISRLAKAIHIANVNDAFKEPVPTES
jgi:small subunit ribosomal protein S20